ncbi:F0F1 ATP synthase subunit B [uncultured Cardiobacterium sp.]|mgnify:FL=1|uniref:F0F1 ATP synthase subunit B n=1 Tax=uncultured Cardiobacterium sp. TaxID=417619 RepID=UPI0026023100|nr:F0F1 ATP synthase subunit B [uncultured Cardiobacterium sp.]
MNLNLTLIGQIGTFLVLWWFTHKYIWPLFAEATEKRRQKIAEGLSMADKAKHSVAAAEEETARLIAQAKTQATEIVGRAQKQAEQLVVDARTEAKTAGEREIAAVRDSFEQEKRKAREALRGQVAELVIQGAEKVIGREVKADDHKRLLHELSEKL